MSLAKRKKETTKRTIKPMPQDKAGRLPARAPAVSLPRKAATIEAIVIRTRDRKNKDINKLFIHGK